MSYPLSTEQPQLFHVGVPEVRIESPTHPSKRNLGGGLITLTKRAITNCKQLQPVATNYNWL